MIIVGIEKTNLFTGGAVEAGATTTDVSLPAIGGMENANYFEPEELGCFELIAPLTDWNWMA